MYLLIVESLDIVDKTQDFLLNKFSCNSGFSCFPPFFDSGRFFERHIGNLGINLFKYKLIWFFIRAGRGLGLERVYWRSDWSRPSFLSESCKLDKNGWFCMAITHNMIWSGPSFRTKFEYVLPGLINHMYPSYFVLTKVSI